MINKECLLNLYLFYIYIYITSIKNLVIFHHMYIRHVSLNVTDKEIDRYLLNCFIRNISPSVNELMHF